MKSPDSMRRRMLSSSARIASAVAAGMIPLRGEHLHMRLAALDVVLVKPFVK
ncbi:MAG: hypothetical protein L6W00_30185 [Lentisphaeria bacterium]|nr:MAG: hypothetical protein L6W00_30185 [Lentisphaeria bacterium]